jgi:hypothetical protein
LGSWGRAGSIKNCGKKKKIKNLKIMGPRHWDAHIIGIRSSLGDLNVQVGLNDTYWSRGSHSFYK